MTVSITSIRVVATVALLSGAAPLATSQARNAAPEPPIAARLSPSAEQVAFIAGDSIFVMWLADGRVRAVAGGVGFEAQAARKQLVWSPDSRFLLFRRGTPPRMSFAVVEAATGEIEDVLPDSVDGRLRTVGNLFTGPPVWSPGSDRIAFLAGRLDQFGAVDVVYIADRQANGGWSVRPLFSDGLEKTAVGWSPHHLAWGSRERSGNTTVTVARVSGDSIESAIQINTGNARVIELVPAPDGMKLLATRSGAAPHVIDVRAAPRIVSSNLPPPTRLDAYIGWSGDSALMAFRHPSEWSSELATVSLPDGDARTVMAAEAMLADGTLAATARGVRIVLAEENGSRPRWYRSVIVTSGSSVIDAGSVTPARFEPPPDPWSTRIVGWEAEDGSTLAAQLLVPSVQRDDVAPTVIVPYGGYRNTALSHTYFLDLLLRELLHDGWQVIRPNTRAANVLQQRSGYGAVQLSDTHELIESLAAQGQADRSRVAVIGHSHGASLAYYYATHSRAFCAAVAVNGRADWVMQAGHDADGLLPGPMGASPEENPALYAAASPLPNARAVSAPILLVAGADDGQILPANATAMADSLRVHSRPFDLLLFDDEGHMIEREANRRELIARARATLAACGARPSG